jgi:hypothetical protein
MGQGITSKIDPAAFSKAIMKIDANYEFFTRNAEEFSPRLKWEFIAEQHAAIYYSAAVKKGTQKI